MPAFAVDFRDAQVIPKPFWRLDSFGVAALDCYNPGSLVELSFAGSLHDAAGLDHRQGSNIHAVIESPTNLARDTSPT